MKMGLQIKANLENLVELSMVEDFRWYLKLQCLNCGEVSDRWQYVTQLETVPTKGGRGHANMVSKCKLCSRENSIDIIKDSLKPYADQEQKFQTVVVFECRGMEPIDFSPRCGWVAEGTERTLFDEVELQEGDWCDYDEKTRQSVGVYDISHQFIKVK